MKSSCLDVVDNGKLDCLVVRESSVFLSELVVLHARYEDLSAHFKVAIHRRTFFFAEVLVVCPLMISIWRVRNDYCILSMGSYSS
jgi:hypothetical protein